MFSCSKCGAQFLKWAGRCGECGGWGTVGEENIQTANDKQPASSTKPGAVESFASLSPASYSLLPTSLSAFDRLLPGGLVAGSVTLVGGEPGIGKSTLLAQLALTLARAGRSVLYVTGEESPHQVLLRLKRLIDRPDGKPGALPATLQFLNHTHADVIAATMEKERPGLVIVDSVQTLRAPNLAGEAGNPAQVKAGAAIVTESAKRTGTPVILVGQVTKDGDLAGPKLIEHLVDTVMMMEGDRDHAFRLLRVLKHRFGATDEVAVLNMTEGGLEEVPDPSAALIAHRPPNASGTIVTCLAQGSRLLLVEIQALVTPAGYGTPFRRATGVDLNRLNLLLAVLGRRVGVAFHDQDVFVNAVGGMDAREPATDLALCLALVSAKKDRPLPPTLAAWGEVGLSGEIRPVGRHELRIKEAARLGLTAIKNCTSVAEALDTLSLV